MALDAPQAGRPTTSVPAAARLLGIDVRTVRARIVRGELPGGAVTKDRRLQWFVYSDALLDAGRAIDHGADTRHAAIEEAAALLLQAHAELQAGLGRGSKDLGHLGRARAELVAHNKAVTKSFDHLQAALTLLGERPSAPNRGDETGTC